MTTFESARDEIAKELTGAAKGFLSKEEESPFWTEIAGLFAAEKLRYEAAETPEEKAKIAQNLTVIQTTIETRLARKKLKVRNAAENVAKIVMKVAVTQFFPGAGLLIG